MGGIRLLLCFSCCVLWAKIACAARAPQDSSVLGADLLIGAAKDCDMLGAWRVLNLSSFKDEWLTQTGSGGDTPVAAAVRTGCAELVALLVMQPGFNDKTLRKRRLRREMVNHLMDTWQGKKHQMADAGWCLDVIDGLLVGKVSKKELEWDPMLVNKEFVWFVPEPGEWFRPLTFDEMEINRTAPDWNLTGYIGSVDRRSGTGFDRDGNMVRLQDFDKLWYLIVHWIQLDPDKHKEFDEWIMSNIRSIGWSLFFWGGRGALLAHAMLIETVAHFTELNRPPDDAPAHSYLRRIGANISESYLCMSDTLLRMWNGTGNWIMPGEEVGEVDDSKVFSDEPVLAPPPAVAPRLN